VFYLFAALLAWQLGGLPVATLALMRGITWAFALSFAAITVVSWRYLFIIPVAFSIAITVCLTAAAWISAKQVTPDSIAMVWRGNSNGGSGSPLGRPGGGSS